MVLKTHSHCAIYDCDLFLLLTGCKLVGDGYCSHTMYNPIAAIRKIAVAIVFCELALRTFEVVPAYSHFIQVQSDVN